MSATAAQSSKLKDLLLVVKNVPRDNVVTCELLLWPLTPLPKIKQKDAVIRNI